MRTRIVPLLLPLLFAAHAYAATDCHGVAFGQVKRPFVGVSPQEAMFSATLPEGIEPPRHSIAAGGWNWGCSTTVLIDLDRAKSYRVFQCSPDASPYASAWPRESQGAKTRRITDSSGRVTDEAVVERTLAPAVIERLICLANEAWQLDPNGDPVTYDAHGKAIPPSLQPPAPPHGVSYLRLRDGDIEKLIGGFSHYPANGDAGALERYVWQVVDNH